MSFRKPWKDDLWQGVMILCSQLGVRHTGLKGYYRFAREGRRGERLYAGQMLETYVLELVEKYVKRGKVREVLRTLATELFSISPKAVLGNV